MKTAVISAGVWGVAGIRREVDLEEDSRSERVLEPSTGWNPERFERDQIRGLVLQAFSPRMSPPVQQLLFSAVEPETDVLGICERVGETLATETSADVLVVTGKGSLVHGSGPVCRPESVAYPTQGRSMRESATRLRRNLWLAPPRETGEDDVGTASVRAYLEEVRREFEYSIVAAPAAGESNEALAMAQFADGIILVLSAKHTRRENARRIIDLLTQVRLLGTVLADREFPMPEGIYRRL
ncbi:MAG TPA: hypothetical protein VE377_13675 [Candidatus Dormibacteraeota bacterium]|nr:hypothetical protein [Candidatus Dormibacteraeota bacterium]